jgi:CHAT domain-containing protein/Tfp pilus assembly protein PilF
LSPDGLAVAGSLINLGLLAHYRGDLTTAETLYHRALAIDERLSPGTIDTAVDYNNLGLVAQDRGDLKKAEGYYRQALAIQQELLPGSQNIGITLNNLANVVDEQGDIASAEQYHLRALEIFRRLAPRGTDVAASLHNLGSIASYRGDFAAARMYHRQALAIREKVVPGGLSVAASLTALGEIEYKCQNYAKAEEYQSRAIAIRKKQAPGSLAVADNLSALGGIAVQSGNFVRAESYLREAIELFERLAPSGPNMAVAQTRMGDVATRRRKITSAEAHYHRAIGIWKTLSPNSTDAAEAQGSLAALMGKQGKPEEAAKLLAASIAALEAQTALLGGSNEARSAYRARHAGYYQDYVALLMARKQPELAFEALERSRARTLLWVLGEASVDIRRGADAALLESARSTEALLRAKTNRRIELTGGSNKEELAILTREVEELLTQDREIQGRIRAASAGYAALVHPQPLTAQAVEKQLLDSRTMLLEYALGTESSYLFALTPATLEVYKLPKRTDIERAALRVHGLLAAGDRWDEATYRAAVRELSATVLGPVAARLGDKRLLIVSDGALQYVPFGVLPIPGRPPRDTVPLVVEHEIVNLPSASVLAVLREEQTRRPAQWPKTVAVLADPVFDSNDARVLRAKGQRRPDPPKPVVATAEPPVSRGRLVRAVGDAGLGTAKGSVLPRLPFSRREAAMIAALAPGERGLLAVDFEASRETATSPALAGYQIVHFATHGLLDSRHPELSGLVLSMVDQQGKPRNGFLGLEDIFNLNLPVDLVVLSACETALGKDVSGEGLVGLTRGFMYAGAPRVVASLWKVDDVATAELMERFYRGMLTGGLRPAEALRQAQLEMRKQSRWSAPYYWGGFTLQGEWR